MATAYYELLKDPRWQRLRLEVMQRENFKCQRCGDDKSTLNVHHRYYKKGHKPWEYQSDDLECLCEKCHLQVEQVLLCLRVVASSLGGSLQQRLVGYCVALRSLGLEAIIGHSEPSEDFIYGVVDGLERLSGRYLKATPEAVRGIIGRNKKFGINELCELSSGFENGEGI